ncbi:allergen Tab y 5.0101 [Drosophila grimshawi]|nr:allergen Tab y 5.0101 [Drosophila grimshawi]
MSSSCMPGAKMISLAPHKTHLLHLINKFRNKAAAGYTRTLFPAGRMARMVWSAELENFAQMYIKKCASDLRPCMASSQFTVIGSIYDGLSYTGKPNLHKVTEITDELLNGWFEDARFVTRQLLLHLTTDFRRPTVRLSVLLMADRNTHVGCSAMRFASGFVNNFHMACAFATDNMRNKPIYKIHAVPGRLCKKRDDTYRNLCAIGEKYNNRHKYQVGEVLPTSVEVLAGSTL